MARAHWIKSSRVEHTCSKGGHVIPSGDGYYWAAPGFRSRKRYRCATHPFRPSELTTSAASAPMAAVEEFTDTASSVETIEDLQSAWDDLVGAVEEYQQEREGALEAWEHGNSQLEEYVETANAAVDEVNGHTITEFDEEEPDREDEGDVESDEWQEWDERRQEHLEDQVGEAVAVAEGLAFL